MIIFQELLLEQLKHETKTLNSELENKDANIHSLERQLEDVRDMHTSSKEEVSLIT